MTSELECLMSSLRYDCLVIMLNLLLTSCFPLYLQLEGSPVVGRPLTVHAILDNPIPRTLTRAYFLIEGPGLTDPIKIPVKKYVYHSCLYDYDLLIFVFTLTETLLLEEKQE